MKLLSGFAFLILLMIPTYNLFAQMNSPLDTAFQSALDKKMTLVQKEAFVKLVSARVQSKVDVLLKRGKTSEILTRFADILSETSVSFPLPRETDIVSLDTNIRAGNITLQARANGPTPIFYTGGFRNIFGGATGTELLLDEYHQVDPLETVALSGATFHIVGVSVDHEHVIYQVTTPDYPYTTEKGYYIDARFVDVFWMPIATLALREKYLPTKEIILANLRNSLGLPYIWGGNIPTGVPKLLEYHSPKGFVDEDLRAKWTFRGVDCSGLLYAATDGFIPRNTSAMVNFGTGLDIAGKTSEEIIPLLQPLDVIVWKGHMLIVLNQSEVIQSKADYGTGTIGFQDGVKISPLKEVLDGLFVSRIPLNSIDDTVPEGKKKLVIRRWYDNP